MTQPQIILLKEGADSSQGKGQLLSNIGACAVVVDTIKTTLGPCGMDKLIVDKKGTTTISNDGATILRLLDVVHPAARVLVDIAQAQDAEVGDGTTSVVILAGELLQQAKSFIEDDFPPRLIVQGYRQACQVALEKIDELAVRVEDKETSAFRTLLEKCASTAMTSKLVSSQKGFFKKLVVSAVLALDEHLDDKLIGIKKIPGGALQDTRLIRGVGFKKTFSYAGFEQQPKKLANPCILCLNLELELKAERDNAEIRIDKVEEYQAVVDAEWTLFYDKLDKIADAGANIVLSRLPIGDLATQYFADRNMFCAGRIGADDLDRVVRAVGGSIQTSVNNLAPEHLGTCGMFEEEQIGSERYNIFTECPLAKTATFLLRGGSEQFISEVERSIHDAICVVRRLIKTTLIVGGGGAVEMELSKFLRAKSKEIPGKLQLVVAAFARSLEVIPRQLCINGGFDAIDLLNRLRRDHQEGRIWNGVDFQTQSVADNMDQFVWEPALVKTNLIKAASEAACLILSVDETIHSPPNDPAPGLGQ